MIRTANHADATMIAAMAYDMHKQSRFATDYPFDHDKFAQMLAVAIDSDTYCVRVSIEQDGTINGGLIGFVSPQFFSAAMVAQDVGMFVVPSARQAGIGKDLATAFYEWACDVGAVDCEMGCNTGVARSGFGQLMDHMGFENVGDLFSKRCR